MNKTAKITALGLMALAMAVVVAAVSPQLLAAGTPTVEAGQASNVATITAPQSDVVDAYNWRTTVSPGKNKGGI